MALTGCIVERKGLFHQRLRHTSGQKFTTGKCQVAAAADETKPKLTRDARCKWFSYNDLCIAELFATAFNIAIYTNFHVCAYNGE
jgi:hypothetical protein